MFSGLLNCIDGLCKVCTVSGSRFLLVVCAAAMQFLRSSLKHEALLLTEEILLSCKRRNDDGM